ncbi:PH domain-containing protein [Candidatus Woesearchaeota archaeon]|nr:PH domain-containing protein [Candidatus Woesearchaeota archaeon]
MKGLELPIIVKPNVGVSVLKAIFVEVIPLAFIPIVLIITWSVTNTLNVSVAVLLVIGVIFFLSVRPFLTALNMKATTYKIDQTGVYFFEGFFTKREKFLPMKKATDVRLVQRWPLDVLFNTGSVVIETAGRSSALVLRTLSHPRKYYEALRMIILSVEK